MDDADATIVSAPRATWLGRTFGWSGSREQWLALLGTVAWLGGLLAIFHYSQTRSWTIGESLFATLGWFLVLGIAAHEAVRDLFGPVFFFDLLRVSRNKATFMIRGLYVVCISAFLALFYYEWLLDQSTRSYEVRGEFAIVGLVVSLCVGYGLFRVTRGQWHPIVRRLVLSLGIILAAICLIAAIAEFTHSYPTYESSLKSLPASAMSKFAMSFFEAFVVVQFIVVCLLTPVYVAGTIAVEKEKKTLEFLLATDLRNREIVFGKMASRVLLLVMYVLAGLPLLAFLQLFGGIDPEQLLAATTATIVTILGLASLSIWVSVNLRKARDAIIITYMLAILYGFLSILCAGFMMTPWATASWWYSSFDFLGISLGVPDLAFTFADGNVIWAFIKIQMSSRGGPAVGGLTTGMAGVLREYVVFWGVAIVLLMLSAIWRIRCVALNQAYGSVIGRRRKKTRLHPKVEGQRPIARDRAERDNSRPPISGNPVTWKEVFVDSTFRGGCLGRIVGALILVLTFVPLAFIVWMCFYESRRFAGGTYNWSFAELWYQFTQAINGWARVVTGVLGFLMFMAACIRGAGAITAEKDRDTWTSLMSTPLSAEEILWGKWWGCILSLRRAFGVLLIVWAIGLGTGSIMPGMLLVMLPLTAIYVSAYAWTGLYCSMTARTSLIASVRGFFAGLFLSGGFWIVLGLVCFLPLSFTRGNSVFVDQLSSFFAGFTPPLVYGIFPLHGAERFELGPFEMDRERSAGLAGPVVGTLFWILFNYIMMSLCVVKFRAVTNRDVRKPKGPPPPRREDPSESSESAE